jgi:hypothetical protein
MSYELAAIGVITWVASGIAGVRAILNLWYSGILRDMRPQRLDAWYIVVGAIFGPTYLLIAAAWYLMGMGDD